MEKTITITQEKYRKLVAEVTAEITAEHGEDAPQGALLFALFCVAFSTMLARKLFLEDGDDKKTRTEPSFEQMRAELHDFCNHRSCIGCPMDRDGFECGRGKYFTSPAGDSAYMTDESIVRHYRAMKGEKL